MRRHRELEVADPQRALLDHVQSGLGQHAVVDGIDPDGDTLSTWMPRWQLAGANWDDLLAYLKTLQ